MLNLYTGSLFRVVIFSAVVTITLCCGKKETQMSSDAQGSPVIHKIEGGDSEVHANAYLIEGKDGVVAVDALLTVVGGKKVRGKIDSLEKPLQAVLLTHGHPDHYGGLTSLLEGLNDIPIIAIAGVDEVIRRDDSLKASVIIPAGINWPEKRTFPNRTVEPNTPLTFGEIVLTPKAIGPSESDYNSLWEMKTDSLSHLFLSDIIMEGMNAYMADGHTGEWISVLTSLKDTLTDNAVIYSGHGDIGNKELLTRQISYLRHFRNEVRKIANDKNFLTNAQIEELQHRMKIYLGNEKMARWIGESANPVAKELSKE